MHQARVFAPGIPEFWQNVTIVADTISRVDFTWHATEPGTDVTIEDPINEVTVTFDEVTDSGQTWVSVSDQEPAPTTGFDFLGTYYDISTTATCTGNITMTIAYDEADIPDGQAEEDLRLLHWDGAVPDDVTVLPVDTDNNQITGVVTSLCRLAVGIPPVVTWLPPLSNETAYQAQAGSTVPVKFQLTDADGNMVSDQNVMVTVMPNSGGVAVLTGLAIYETEIPGYRINVKTKGWDIGDYTIHISINQDAEYDLSVVEKGKAKGKQQ